MNIFSSTNGHQKFAACIAAIGLSLCLRAQDEPKTQEMPGTVSQEGSLLIRYLVEKNEGETTITNPFLGSITGDWKEGSATLTTVKKITDGCYVGPNSFGGSDYIRAGANEVLVLARLTCSPPAPARVIDLSGTALALSDSEIVRPLAIQASEKLNGFHSFSNGNGVMLNDGNFAAIGNNIPYGRGYAVVFGGHFEKDSVVHLVFRLRAEQAGGKMTLVSQKPEK